jgi:type IV secretory pathway TrbL component
MNKKNQGIEVKLSVIAISAILVASLFVMGSSRFIPGAMAQNFTDQIGGAANQTGAAAGGAANQTGAAAGGAANQTGAMVMIPQAAMTSIMDDIGTVRGAVDEGDTEAVDALDNIEMQLRTAAGLPLEDTEAAADDEEAAADDEEAAADDEEAAADEDEAAADEDEAAAEDDEAAAEDDETP